MMENLRFKFRVWDKAENKYNGFSFHLAMSGELDRLSVDGDLLETDEDRFIIEQCTGLKDKNGKLIYEGDMVDMYIPQEDAHRKCVVEYVIDGGTAQWVCRYLEGKRMHSTFGGSFEITAEYLDGDYCKVIGSIHEMGKENE